MKPELLKVLSKPDHSFSVRRDEGAYFYNRWHFHPEVELLYIENGSGIQFMGDNITRFKKGDMVLVGSNLPHFWKCDDAYFAKNSKLKAIATVAHFREDFWGKEFLELLENRKIKELFYKAKKAMAINGTTKKEVCKLLADLLYAQDTNRIIILLQVLRLIAGSRNTKVISSTTFEQSTENKETDKINIIYKYSLENFKDKISLIKISAQANISPKSFCRYFKSHTRKTYNTFLQELRVGYATKLLVENKLNITQICYNSGFNNVTNFYKSFKKITGKTPLIYQRSFLGSE